MLPFELSSGRMYGVGMKFVGSLLVHVVGSLSLRDEDFAVRRKTLEIGTSLYLCDRSSGMCCIFLEIMGDVCIFGSAFDVDGASVEDVR